MAEPLLTLREVAQLLRISKSKLYHERKAGRLVVVRFGGAVRVREEDLQNYIEAAAQTRDKDGQVLEVLVETLSELRAVRDKILGEDPSSKGGLALAQLSLILTRFTHGIPSKRVDFESLIRFYERTA